MPTVVDRTWAIGATRHITVADHVRYNLLITADIFGAVIALLGTPSGLRKMQEQPEAEHEKQQATKGDEKALYCAIRQSEKETQSCYYKARKYFSKFKNWVSLLTLLFVAG